MHVKAYFEGLGHGKHLKAHYAMLVGPAKVPTFKVAKIDPLEILSHPARSQDFIKITFAVGAWPPGAPFSGGKLQKPRVVGLKMDKMRIVALKIFSHL